MKEIIGITLSIAFVGGISLGIYGFWLTKHAEVARGKKLIAIGVFTTFFAMIGSLFIETLY
jgi:hypothetical protein